jgi:SP family sugar:H+ symporter-like MFS transporter
VTNILVTLVAIALVDWIGRKPLLIVGSLGMALTLGVMAFVFGTAPTAMVAGSAEPQLDPTAGLVAIVAANLYVVFFGVSWGPVTWVLLGEMFNNRIRAYALAVAQRRNGLPTISSRKLSRRWPASTSALPMASIR